MVWPEQRFIPEGQPGEFPPFLAWLALLHFSEYPDECCLGNRPQDQSLPGGDVADTAVALIVAGSGDTNEDEVFDLLADSYPQDLYGEIGVIFPTDKELFTEAVDHVVNWAGEDALYPFHTKGASFSRKTSKFKESQEIGEFAEIFDPREYEDWDEVHFLLAMPEDPEDPDYDLYAGLAQAAIDAGVVVKDLTRGLDDVQIADEETAPEPEPEPEKPARRTRRKKAEEPESESEDGLQEDLAAAAFEAEKAAGDPWAGAPVPDGVRHQQAMFEALGDVVEAFIHLREVYALYSSPPPDFEGYFAAMNTRHEDDPKKDQEPSTEEPEQPKRRGRGRPRTNFGVSEVYDEDSETWVPRPEGRLKKGTKWRKVHKDTGDVLETGTA